MKRPMIWLGSWTCPSGNTVDAFFRRERSGLEAVDFEWEAPPPLCPDDHAYYLATILPEVHRRLAEWQELPVGRALVVRQ